MTSRLKWRPMDYILFVIALTLCSSILIMISVPLIMTTWFGAKIQGQRDKEE